MGRVCVLSWLNFLLTGWLKEKYDNVYLRGRDCIESARRSFKFFDFELFFPLFLGLSLFVFFVDLAVFPSSK
jgi:hypothetical protein